MKGFVDCHTFAKKKCEQTMVSFSIRILAKVLLDKENVEIYKASDRSRLAYEVGVLLEEFSFAACHLNSPTRSRNARTCISLLKRVFIFQIVQHLCAGASEIGSGAASPNTEIVRTVLPFTTSVNHELKVLEDLQVVLGRQNTLKPIFAQFLGYRWMSYHERRNALQLRKYLVDAFIDYDMLKTAWSKVRSNLNVVIM